MAFNKDMANAGFDLTRLMKASRLIGRSCTSVSAIAEAARGALFTSAISPRMPPSPTRSTNVPCIDTEISPERTTYMEESFSPSRMMVVVAGIVSDSSAPMAVASCLTSDLLNTFSWILPAFLRRPVFFRNSDVKRNRLNMMRISISANSGVVQNRLQKLKWV